MDSLTQIVLGAAVGEVIAGRKLGRQAMLWGAVAGTIPDLDVLANPFLDVVQELRWHRSLSHSLLFAFIVAPLLGWLFSQWKPKASFATWTRLFFWGFVTHAWLDIFTTWGTKIFYPFYDYGLATKSIFVIDLFYTVPFMTFLIWAAIIKPFDEHGKYRQKRSILVWTGIAISSLYLGLGLWNQNRVNEVFEQSLKVQNIDYFRYDTKTTPLNILLWNNIVETKEGYYSGYYSVLDKNKEIKYHYFPKNWEMLSEIKDNYKLQQLIEVTQGYYTVEKSVKGYQINDLRFGQLNGWQDGKGDFVFVYLIEQNPDGSLSFEQKRNNFKEGFELVGQLIDRALGNEE